MVTASPHSYHKCLFTIICGLAHIVQKFPLVHHNSKMAAAVEFPFSYGKPELSAPKDYGRIDPSIFWSRGRKRTTFRNIPSFIVFFCRVILLDIFVFVQTRSNIEKDFARISCKLLSSSLYLQHFKRFSQEI